MKTLYIIPSAPIYHDGRDYWVDEKTNDGLSYFNNKWNGSVVVCFQKSNIPIIFNRVNEDNFNFKFIVYDENIDLSNAGLNDVVLASADDYRQLSLFKKYPSLKKNIVYVLENTFRTRLEIILSEKRNWMKILGGVKFLILNELRIRRALKKCAGLQANGYPAYMNYNKYCANSIYFFDTRYSSSFLKNKSIKKFQSGIIRLAYSGRLMKIKGSNFLVPLAKFLKNLGVEFSLKIYGDGEFFDLMRAEIVREELSGMVSLLGAVDYKDVLIPAIFNEADLFVMPHIQGDPSCTYFETLALGVPIIGFANEAWRGILENFGDVGWSVPLRDVEKMALLIKNIHQNRDVLIEKTNNVKKMAGNINFESQFDKRLEQLESI